MLHQSKEENGVEKMLPVKSVPVPAHGTLSFAPGGYHLMCMQPQASMVHRQKRPGHAEIRRRLKRYRRSFRCKGPGGK